jgi:hypothetical protein
LAVAQAVSADTGLAGWAAPIARLMIDDLAADERISDSPFSRLVGDVSRHHVVDARVADIDLPGVASVGARPADRQGPGSEAAQKVKQLFGRK